MTAFTVVILLVTAGVSSGLNNWQGEHRRTYRMSDCYLNTGSGRKAAWFNFKNSKVMIIGNGYIELRARFGAFRVYIPEDDFDIVKEYIQCRVPGGCEIRVS